MSSVYSLYPTPRCRVYTLHLYPIPYTLHPIPYTLYPIPYTLYPVPYTLYPIPYTLYPIPYTLYPIPYTLYPIRVTHIAHAFIPQDTRRIEVGLRRVGAQQTHSRVEAVRRHHYFLI